MDNILFVFALEQMLSSSEVDSAAVDSSLSQASPSMTATMEVALWACAIFILTLVFFVVSSVRASDKERDAD